MQSPLSPVSHSSNHEYHCCQLTRKSSCVSNFYRNFKVLIWPSLIHFWSYLAKFLLEWIIFQTNVVEKIKTHILCSIPFWKSAFYEIMLKNTLQPSRLKMKIWRMCIACWIPKAINTHSKYVTHIAFPRNNCCMSATQCYVTQTVCLGWLTVVLTQYMT